MGWIRFRGARVSRSFSFLLSARTLVGQEQGVFVLASALMLLALSAIVSAASVTAMLMDLRVSGYYATRLVVFYIAEAGVNRALHELLDADGDRDVTAIAGPTVMFQGEVLNGGSYTVVVTPITGAVPAQLKLKSTGCYPADDPCPAFHATSVVELLLESMPEAAEPKERARVIAWREVY